MQEIQHFEESSQILCPKTDIRNLKLESHLVQVDSILNRLQIRERFLVAHMVYAVKNNLPSGMIYAKELQQVRILTAKISYIHLQMKRFHTSVVAAKKHDWRQNN